MIITNKAIDFESIWREQSVITPSLYNELGGDVTSIYAKLLSGNNSITYKFKTTYTSTSGRKMNKWGIKSIADSELEKLKEKPVKRGRWEDCSNGWMCSCCERDSTKDTPFCPNCGARMDGDVK